MSVSTLPGAAESTTSGENDRAALEGMLKSYPVNQLVEEVLVAWDELTSRNDDLVSTKQRLRILELDLAEREDGVAPEIALLQEAEEGIREKEAKIVHLTRLLEDTKSELAANASSISAEERENMEKENSQLRTLADEQNEVISEMEGKVEQLVLALDRAAEAGLTSVTDDEVRALKSKLTQS